MSEQTTSATCDRQTQAGKQPGSLDPPALARDPDDILNDADLSNANKRELLASLASDRHAVADQQALRRADETLFYIDDLLQALKSLDRADTRVTGDRLDHRSKAGLRRRQRRPARDAWFINRIKKSGRDDDDDPPPCPAGARPFGPAPMDGNIGALVAA